VPVPVLHIRDLICKSRVVRLVIILSKYKLVTTRDDKCRIAKQHAQHMEVRYEMTEYSILMGTSLGTLFVRHGGLNSAVMFLPTIAPATVRGKCTNRKMAIMS
jgi:hypothetical protein